jgi:hypothetical protein
MTKVLNKRPIAHDPHCYVFQDGDRGNRWYLYFYDQERQSRHRHSLGRIAPNDVLEAERKGLAKYIEFKTKSERGEQIRTLTTEEMADRFLGKQKKRISAIPHNGISAKRYLQMEHHARWFLKYTGQTLRPIHKIPRNFFANYETWRKEAARQEGKEIPRQTTINAEISTFRRMYEEVAVQEGFLSKDSIPTLKSVRLAKDKKHRRDDLTPDEWQELERSARLYWREGRTRWSEEGGMNKNEAGRNILRSTLGNSNRAKSQKTHRKMLYLAMRISMETGIRIGSLRKIQWGHIRKNSALSDTDQKTWVLIDVPAENTKTGRRYTINAPIARHLEELRRITKFKSRNEILFTNQCTGVAFSERIWKDSLCEMLVEAGLAQWADDDSNNHRKIVINSGKNLTWYSFRHTYITFQLTLNETPVAIVAAQCDTSIKYIEEHYFHYRAELSTPTLAKGRKTLKSAENDLEWLQIRPAEQPTDNQT